MEQDNVQNVETEKVETEKAETQTAEQTEGAFKVFKTKKEYDDAYDKMKASILPPKEEMEQFKQWKESQKTQEDKYNELVQKDNEKDKTISDLKRQNSVLKAGITDEDQIEFICYKIGKMEGDFEENLKNYLTENPKFAQTQETKATGIENKSSSIAKEDGVMAILKAKHPDIDF